MPIIKTNNNRIIIKKAKSMCIIPYVYSEDIADYVLGDTVYDISSIIGDSITLEQSDGETTSKENEFTGEIIVENVSTGKMVFSAQCLDLQNNVLKAIFNTYTNSEAGITAFKKDFETNFALIRIRLQDNDSPDIYLPKVALNTKLALSQLKTRGSQGNINGTAMSTICSVIQTTTDGVTPGLLEPFQDDEIYQVDTPLFFVPRTKTPLFLHHIEYTGDFQVDSYYFDEIDFSVSQSSNCLHNRVSTSENFSQYQIFL